MSFVFSWQNTKGGYILQKEPTIKENKMGTMPVGKLLLSISLPMVISMLVQALYNIVDSIFVAKISENALTAVSLAFPMQNLMISVGTGTGVGVNALLSRSLGEKNQKVANQTANISILLAVVNFAFFAVLGLFFTWPFFAAQTGTLEIIDLGSSYLTVCLVFSFGLFGQFAFERLLQSTGKTFCSMIAQSTGAIINIILDPILIFGLFGFPAMGVTGAAAATVFGQIIAMLTAIFLNLGFNKEIHFSLRLMKPRMNIIKRIYAVGFPSILMVSISSVMTFMFNKILLFFTSTAAAVFGVYFKLQSFVFMPVFGLNNGMVPIIAYNYGARRYSRIKKTLFLSITSACSLMLVGLIVMQIIPGKLLLMFNASDAMLSIGIPALRIISLSFIFAGFGIVASSVFQALGSSIYSLIISVARQLVVLLPAAYLLSMFRRLDLVWFAFPISEIISVLLSFIFLHIVLKRLQREIL